MDENKVIVSTEMKQALVNLRNLEEIYVIMSGVTKMPFVLCDEETFDDEVLVYYQEESAKEKAKTLAEDRYHVGIAKIEKNARLGFFTNLYTMGVNALAVNVGTEEEIRVRTIYDLEVEKEGELITIRVRGNGFLYNMVRILAGTLIGVGRGAIAPEQIPAILEAKDRQAAGMTVPPQGLRLVEIDYLEEKSK